jgi:hypothetical protein
MLLLLLLLMQLLSCWGAGGPLAAFSVVNDVEHASGAGVVVAEAAEVIGEHR